MQATESLVLTTSSMTEYFRESVPAAMRNQNVDTDEQTVFYLVSMLGLFSRSDALYEQTSDGIAFRPLAEIYGDAVQAESSQERDMHLRRLGDIALFMGGVFSRFGRRRGVGIDYYINMGGGAYSWLSDSDRLSSTFRPLANTFTELADKFVDFIDVLAEVCESPTMKSDRDLLRLYEFWQKTKSNRARRQLSEAGIVPLETGLNASH